MTLWLLMRASGLVALVLLTATVVLGVVSTAPHGGRWPRWLSQAVHRDLSLLSVALVAAHVATSVLDPHVPIGPLDVVAPFGVSYRPLWVGLGTLATDLLLAILLSSALRLRLGGKVWRRVHRLAYAAWPLAVMHGVGTGTDAAAPAVTGLTVACVTTVLVTVGWRAALQPHLVRVVSLLGTFALAGWVLPR